MPIGVQNDVIMMSRADLDQKQALAFLKATAITAMPARRSRLCVKNFFLQENGVRDSGEKREKAGKGTGDTK